MESGARLLGFESWLHHLASLCLSFPLKNGGNDNHPCLIELRLKELTFVR